MSRLQQRFYSLREQSRAALIPYITAGDPHPNLTVPLMHAMVTAGADIIEVGVPFSDPMADGPVIQLACERALAHGVHLRQILDMVAEFREQDTETPVVLMGYMNPIESLGIEQFAERARDVGVDGLLAVDLGIEEAPDVLPRVTASQLDSIFLVAPTTSDARIAEICQVAQGFIYYVSLKGVTGSDRLDTSAIEARLQSIRVHSKLPIAVGFGIRTATDAAAVARVADAVVVGSALVSLIAEHVDDDQAILREVPKALALMRQSMDEARVARVAKPSPNNDTTVGQLGNNGEQT